ncbi:hypothetical protein L5515_012687 [Caenorhabditis briggsae]|uniref:Uncharacterized protein n=2 Tax=Caenorhabditis briggsae TaxID=6238 RepID=A0AAE9F1T4_CAEBR|nr:hypothetical protein L5515_012687 [Caenorhabditis briggsae]
MDEDSLLLDDSDSPEDVQKRVFSLVKLLAAGEVPELTERDVENVEETLKKAQNGLKLAKKSMLTDEDILKVENLNFLSPNPNLVKSNVKRSKVPSFSSLDELDYEESLDGLEIDEDDDDLASKKEKGEPQSFLESPEAPSPHKKRKNTGLKIMENRLERKSVKADESDVIFLSSDSDSSDDMPQKRQKIVFDTRKSVKQEELGSEGDDEDDELGNVSRANFLKKLTKDEPYLKLRASQLKCTSSKVGLTYPLGVTYDSPTETWFVTNIPHHLEGDGVPGESKVLKIYTGSDRRRSKYTDIEDSLLDNPSAITIYKDGSMVAVLCSDVYNRPSIRLINFRRDDRVSNFCSWKYTELDFNYPARGLARSKGGNLITTDRPAQQHPRLRIFSKKSGTAEQLTFQLKNADIPCFIAASDDTVVITDLGAVQTVMLIRLDDSDWKRTKYEMLRIISTAGVSCSAEEMLNNKYFLYVSGAQIDRNKNILIADAKNHHFKLFSPGMKFVSRVSTDFPVPYVSSFHVNQHGECLILSTRETSKVHFAKLTSTNRLERHIKSGCGKRVGAKTLLSSSRRRQTYKNGI